MRVTQRRFRAVESYENLGCDDVVVEFRFVDVSEEVANRMARMFGQPAMRR